MYDIAHRIGAYFGKLPENVYLHAGTRIGARAFNIKGDSIDPKTLPKPFLWLSPAEIEDCLCIYKEELHGVRSQRGVVAALDAVLQAGNGAVWCNFVALFSILLNAHCAPPAGSPVKCRAAAEPRER